LYLAQFETYVYAGNLRHVEFDFGARDRFEAGLLNGELVSAGVEQRDRVIVLRVRAAGVTDAGFTVGDSDLRLGNGRSRGVGYETGDLYRLTEGGGRHNDERAEADFHGTS